jgi:hypothetical protein
MNAKKKAPVRGRTDTARVDPVKDYKQHIMKADLKKLASKLRLFGYGSVEELPTLPLICRLKKQGPIILHPKHKFDPHIGEIREFVRPITPDSLHTLKALVGVPNEVALKEQRRVQTGAYMRKVQIQDLPVESKLRFRSLDFQARTAVTDMAHNLLHGYADDDRIKRQPYKAVVDYMLERAKDLPTFTAKELIVCPGETIFFDGFAAMFFVNVIVYGNGQIKVSNNAKLHAYQIKHVPV